VQVPAIGFALRDQRTPWYAKALAFLLVAYAISPVDLTPDFIPVLGYLDDVVLLPAGVALFVRLVPPYVWTECERRAERASPAASRAGLVVAAIVVLLWIGVTVGLGWLVLGCMRARR